MRSISGFITQLFFGAVFFFLGFFGYAKFYRMVLPDVPGIQYQMDLAQVISNQFFFCCDYSCCAIVFICYLAGDSATEH